MTTNANAAIVYTGFLGNTISMPFVGVVGSAVPSQVTIGGGVYTMELYEAYPYGYAALMSVFAFEFGMQPRPGVGSVLLTSAGSKFAKRLNSGSSVPTGGAFGQTGRIFSRAPSGTLGQWQPGQPEFAGIRFHEADGSHFGWLRLIVRQGPAGIPLSFTLVDGAYNTDPGESIVAGDGVTGTPEPNAEALLLLAVGSVGVAAWRRKRLARAEGRATEEGAAS